MNIKELYRWPLGGGSFMVLGESPGHELFRGIERDGWPQVHHSREFGGWIPLEGSAEEDLALEILRLREELVEARRVENLYKVTNASLNEQLIELKERDKSRLERMVAMEAKNRELAAALEELQAQEKPKAKRRSLGRAEDVELPMSLLLSQEFKDAWTEYLDTRRDNRWTTSEGWARKVLEQLNRWPADVSAKALRKASLGPWMSVHPEKEVAQRIEHPQAPVPPYFNRRSV